MFPVPHRALVTIILATYNRARYLDTCISSVLAQTFTDWELLVIDDGSTDHSFLVFRLHSAIIAPFSTVATRPCPNISRHVSPICRHTPP